MAQSVNVALIVSSFVVAGGGTWGFAPPPAPGRPAAFGVAAQVNRVDETARATALPAAGAVGPGPARAAERAVVGP